MAPPSPGLSWQTQLLFVLFVLHVTFYYAMLLPLSFLLSSPNITGLPSFFLSFALLLKPIRVHRSWSLFLFFPLFFFYHSLLLVFSLPMHSLSENTLYSSVGRSVVQSCAHCHSRSIRFYAVIAPHRHKFYFLSFY